MGRAKLVAIVLLFSIVACYVSADATVAGLTSLQNLTVSQRLGIGITNPLIKLQIQNTANIPSLYINQSNSHHVLWGYQNTPSLEAAEFLMGDVNASRGTYYFGRNADSTQTAAAVMQIKQLNAADDQVVLKLNQSGTNYALDVVGKVKVSSNVTVLGVVDGALDCSNITGAASDLCTIVPGNSSSEIFDVVNGNVNSTGWNRSGTIVLLANAGDNVQVANNLTVSGILNSMTSYFLRDLAAADTSVPVLKIDQNNASDDQVALWVEQAAVAYALNIKQDGASYGLYIDQNADYNGMIIDSAATTAGRYGLTVDTAGAKVSRFRGLYDANSEVRMGGDNDNEGLLYVYRNIAADKSSGAVATILNDNASDDQVSLWVEQDAPAYALNIRQDAASYGLYIDQNADYNGMIIDSAATTAARYGLTVDTAGAKVSRFRGLYDANSEVRMPGDNDNEGLLYVYRNLGSDKTSGAVMTVISDNSSDDQTVLKIQQDAPALMIEFVGQGACVAGKYGLYANITGDGELYYCQNGAGEKISP